MHLYIDESKAKNYVVVAVLVAPGDLSSYRKAINKLRMPGQNYIHFVNERDSRRRQILSSLERLKIRALVFTVAGQNPIAARALCLGALMDVIGETGVTKLVIELEESAKTSDETSLRDGLLRRGLKKSVEYRHMGKSEEPLLWAADAIAWSFARGGDFQRRALLLIDSVNKISA